MEAIDRKTEQRYEYRHSFVQPDCPEGVNDGITQQLNQVASDGWRIIRIMKKGHWDLWHIVWEREV